MAIKNDLAPQIQARIDSFVNDIEELVRAAALEAVSDALGVGVAAATGRARPAKRAKRAKRAAKKTSRRATSSGKRVRRTADQVEAVAKKVRAQVSSKPGQRLGEIAKAIGMDTKSVRRPAFLLVEAGTLRTEGNRGGTRYFPGGRGGSAPARKKKATKKRAKRKTKARRKTKRG